MEISVYLCVVWNCAVNQAAFVAARKQKSCERILDFSQLRHYAQCISLCWLIQLPRTSLDQFSFANVPSKISCTGKMPPCHSLRRPLWVSGCLSGRFEWAGLSLWSSKFRWSNRFHRPLRGGGVGFIGWLDGWWSVERRPAGCVGVYPNVPPPLWKIGSSPTEIRKIYARKYDPGSGFKWE